MPTKYLDAENKLLDAVHRRLAVGAGPIRERLASAWVAIAILGRAGVDVPPVVGREVDELRKRWSGEEPPQIESYVQTLSDDECVAAAGDIVRWLHVVQESR